MKTVVLVLAVILPAAAQAVPRNLGYWEDQSSTHAMKAEAATLAIVATDVFAVNIHGKLSGSIPANVQKLAAETNIALLATVSNYAGGFKADVATAILTPGKAQDKAVAGILQIAGSVSGINIDFEAVPHKERALYTAFANRLAAALHASGRMLVLSVPAKTADDPNDSWAGAYDYAALADSVDTLQVMTYDENGPWGPPGPVAGLDWVTQCLIYTETVVPLTKISMGMPAYGYDWNLTTGSGGTVNFNAIPALIAKTGAVPQWDSTTSSPWFSFTAPDGASHVVWYENARSTRMKAALAANNAVASVSVWALGLEDRSYWKAVLAGYGDAEQSGTID